MRCRSLSRAFSVLFTVTVLPVVLAAQTPERVKVSLNEHWQFRLDNGGYSEVVGNPAKTWETVNVPHSWNIEDTLDDEPGYYRGGGWYVKTLEVPSSLAGREIYLYFEGANQSTTVWVNGQEAGTHHGGYTRFCFPITALLNPPQGDAPSRNEIAIKVDNAFDPEVPPLSGDFNMSGGLYRDVFLVAVNPVHISLKDRATSGVYISTPHVSADAADVHVKTFLTNASDDDRSLVLETTLQTAEGTVLRSEKTPVAVSAGADLWVETDLPGIPHPRLWSTDDPYLHTVVTRLLDAETGAALDTVIERMGFRYFHFDGEKGFFLNGRHLKLIGTNRHQDVAGHSYAVPDEFHVRDMQRLRDLGGNFLRVAHYPQDAIILDRCDEYGILASVEAPNASEITEDNAAFEANSLEMHREVIRQSFNHPSVIMWCYFNEIHTHVGDRDVEVYAPKVVEQARKIEALSREEDPARETALVSGMKGYMWDRFGLGDISSVSAWNVYFGWYYFTKYDLANFIDDRAKAAHGRSIFLAEFGVGVDPRLHSFEPEAFDFSQEFGVSWHRTELEQILADDRVAIAAIWNLADFHSEHRGDEVPHINNKGILGYDRVPKEVYYMYQARLQKDPVVAIGMKHWNYQGGVSDAPGVETCTRTVAVHSNLDRLRLSLNGIDLGERVVSDFAATWTVPFRQGRNTLVATGERDGKPVTDSTEIHFEVQPAKMSVPASAFHSIKVNVGSRCFMEDRELETVWLPDQPYTPGGWGYVGGEIYRVTDGSVLGYGTNRNIRMTEKDPLYQTQRVGLSEYRFDVPPGHYTLALHFAELQATEKREKLVEEFNDAEEKLQGPANRRFEVLANGALLMPELDLRGDYGEFLAVAKKFDLEVTGDEGLQLKFHSLAGEPVLNAIELRRE